MAFMQRQKNFWNEMLWKPKRPLSLEQLKYHHLTLERNQYITESNKKLLVETFRSIAEILIWGDQNDSSVFDFFLEKNMQSSFLKILSRQPGGYMVLQLLQTMSILFENIKNETSIYYLLSNNHVNSLIVLKLDFSDEEVLAYYISFLKTLSFKLNKHTIHFFFNEHLRDFPLYTEAIKFFNNPESMVRIAVRTLTLNVYKVEDKNTIEFICNKTAAPYFTNLVWFIGNHVLQLDECLEQKSSHLHRNNLESAVAEHLDHLHYMNDILSLQVASLNEILRDHLLNRLFVPLYVYSLIEPTSNSRKEEEAPRVSSKIALFLLSQVFLIISHPVLTTELAFLILTGDQDLSFPSPILRDFDTANESPGRSKHRRNSSRGSVRGFLPPDTSLATSLSRPLRNNASPRPVQRETGQELDIHGSTSSKGGSSGSIKELTVIPEYNGFVVIESPSEREIAELFARQQEEEMRENEEITTDITEEQCFVDITPIHSIPIKSNQYLESILSAIIPGPNDDSRSLFAISLFYAMIHNEGVSNRLLEAFSFRNHKNHKEPYYIQTELVGRLLSVIEASAVGSVRLITLHLCIALLSHLLYLDYSYTVVNTIPDNDPSSEPPVSLLSEHHSKKLERAMEESCRRMEKFYRSLGEGEEVFLELFEDEYSNEQKFFLKVNYLLMDATMLLPATGTPMTGIDFTKRLPCGETEKARKAMRVFFSIRKFCQSMYKEKETYLPLTPTTTSVVTEDVIDTANSDLVRCQIITGESIIERFLVVTASEFILVEPDTTQLGCGIVKFIAFLQDVDVSQDPADNLSLRVVAYHRSRSQIKRRPALTAKITFEDNIRCLATRQNLQRRKDGLRHTKMSIVAAMLRIPPPSSPVRKRDNDLPVTVAEVTQPINISTNTVNQQHTTSVGPSPHKFVTEMLKDTTSEIPKPRHFESFELGLVDNNGIPVSTRVPSPHAYYVSKNDQVMLSLGNDPFESKVKILPPKKNTYQTTEISQEETDYDISVEGGMSATGDDEDNNNYNEEDRWGGGRVRDEGTSRLVESDQHMKHMDSLDIDNDNNSTVQLDSDNTDDIVNDANEQLLLDTDSINSINGVCLTTTPLTDEGISDIKEISSSEVIADNEEERRLFEVETNDDGHSDIVTGNEQYLDEYNTSLVSTERAVTPNSNDNELHKDNEPVNSSNTTSTESAEEWQHDHPLINSS